MTVSVSPAPAKFSFMSANFFGREKNYRDFEGFAESRLSIARTFSPAATYAERIDRLFAEVAAMGFPALDLWMAHCDPGWATRRHLDGLLAASARHGVEIVSLAGWLGGDLAEFEATCRMARDIRCPVLGLWCAVLPDQISGVDALLEKYDLRLGLENHPEETTPQVVREKIGHGRHPRIGSTFDTGWWGTHGVPVLDALEVLRENLVLVHLKNIEAPGAHVAARWDRGCLDLRPVVRRLAETGYDGWISLEYEPLSGDPTDDCRAYLETARRWWNETLS